MNTVDVERRLDLLQLVVLVIAQAEDPNERSELVGLAEALCRQRHLEIDICLTPPRVKILEALAPEVFFEWKMKKLAPET